jgi:hypothetical protein
VVLRAALEMAGRGIHVLPVKAEKAPLTAHGVHDATADPERVAEFWRRYPAGVAMRTGQVSNIVALDLASQDAITEALRRGLPDDTSVVKTRRGWHWYFNAPDEPLQSRDPFPGAESKAKSVYVVASTSMHQSGRRYSSYRLLTASWLIYRSGYWKRWLRASTKMQAAPQP